MRYAWGVMLVLEATLADGYLEALEETVRARVLPELERVPAERREELTRLAGFVEGTGIGVLATPCDRFGAAG